MVETPTPAAAQQSDAQIISEAASRLIEGNYVDEGIRREHLRELQAALAVATEAMGATARKHLRSRLPPGGRPQSQLQVRPEADVHPAR